MTRAAAYEDALKTAQAWLDRWAAHVGNCRGGTELCTCGLHAVRSEVNNVLAYYDPAPEPTPADHPDLAAVNGRLA